MKKSVKLTINLALGALFWGSLSISVAKTHPSLDIPQYDYEWGQWQWASRFNYFSTNQNFEKETRELIPLPNDGSYKVMQWDLGFRWVTIPQAAISFATQFASASSSQIDLTNPQQTNERSNTNLSEARVGFDTVFASFSHYDFIAESSLLIPFEKVDPDADSVLITDGSMNLNMGLGARAIFSDWTSWGRGSFIYRTENRSHLLSYGGGIDYQLAEKNPWTFSGYFEGIWSLIKDSRENIADRNKVYARNGNSYLFYSDDPEYFNLGLSVQKAFLNEWAAKIGFATPITGSSAASGMSIFVDLIWTPDTNESEARRRTIHLIPVTPPKPPPTFKEDTHDGVDQKYFDQVPAFTEKQESPAIKLRQLHPPIPKPAPKKKKINLQNQLNQAEFKIELKTTRKRKKNP